MNTLQNYYQDMTYGIADYRQNILATKLLKYSKNTLSEKKLLDIGCSDGIGPILMGKKLNIAVGSIYGVGINKNLIEESNLKGMNAFLVDLNEQQLPFDNNTFDYITNISLIEHILNVDLHVEEMFRVMKPGGLLGIITPNLGSYVNLISLLFGFQPHKVDTALKYTHGHFSFIKNDQAISHGHLRVYSKMGLIGLLESYGFELEKFFGVKHFNYLKNNFRHQVMNSIESVLKYSFPHWCYELGIIAKKPG